MAKGLAPRLIKPFKTKIRPKGSPMDKAPNGLDYIKILCREETHFAGSVIPWIGAYKLTGPVGAMAIQIPMPNREWVIHVRVTVLGKVQVNLRKQKHDGTWKRLGEIDVAEQLELEKLAGE